MMRVICFSAMVLAFAACRSGDATPAPARAPTAQVAAGAASGSGARTVLDEPRAPLGTDPALALVGVWTFDEAGTRAASDSPWLQALPEGAEGRWEFAAPVEGSGAFLEAWAFGASLDPLADAAGSWQVTGVDEALGTIDFVATKQLPEMPDVTETITATAHFDGADTIIVTTAAAPEVPSVWRRAPDDNTANDGAP